MIDISRSRGVFNAGEFHKDIHIIGVGATGSYLCRNLILHGIKGSQIHVYDYDDVEEHNVANQTYTLADVGKSKVSALSERMNVDYREPVNMHNTKVGKNNKMTGVVFLLVDSFDARRKIMSGLKLKTGIECIIETRLDARAGYVFTMSGMNLDHMKWYQQQLFDDDDEGGEVSVCGTRQTVGASVQLIAGYATWQFINWANDNSRIGTNLFVCFDPMYMEENPIKYNHMG